MVDGGGGRGWSASVRAYVIHASPGYVLDATLSYDHATVDRLWPRIYRSVNAITRRIGDQLDASDVPRLFEIPL